MEYKFNIPRLGSLSGLNQALSPNPIMPGMDPLTMPRSNLISPNSNMMNMNNLNQSLELPKNLYDPNVQPVRADQIPEYSKFGNLMAGSEFTRTPEQLAQMTQTEFAQFDKDRKDARNTRLGMMLQSLSNSFKGETTDPQDLLAMKQNSRIAKERARMKQKFEEDLKYMNPEMQRKAQLLGAEGYAEVLKQNMIDSLSPTKGTTAQRNVNSLTEYKKEYEKLKNIPIESRTEQDKLDLADAEQRYFGMAMTIGSDESDSNLMSLIRANAEPGGFELTYGEKKRDETYATKLQDWEDKGRATFYANQENLAEKVKILKDGVSNVAGPIIGPLGQSIVGSFVASEAKNFQNDINEYVFQTLKEKLGAQFTEREGKMLVKASFDNTLSEEDNLARITRLYESGQRMAESRQAQADYYNNVGGINPYGGGTLKGFQGERFDRQRLMAKVVDLPDDAHAYSEEKIKELAQSNTLTDDQAEYFANLLIYRRTNQQETDIMAGNF